MANVTGAAMHVPAIKSGLSGVGEVVHGTGQHGFSPAMACSARHLLITVRELLVTLRTCCRGGATGTGERVSIITSHAVIEGYEPVPVPRVAWPGRPETAMFRRRSLQPSRRAVLHLQAAGDPAVPSGLGDWFTERAFHFYLAGLRLPGGLALAGGLALSGGLALAGRDAGRPLGAAFTDLEAACAQLRDADGIGHVIVAAQGRAALAVALWADARSEDLAGGGADALILSEPALPARPVLNLKIACPVLVLTSPVSSGRARSGALRTGLLQRRPAAIAQLGSHVTWLQLREASEQALFDELGRWLGAYMYGCGRDQLL